MKILKILLVIVAVIVVAVGGALFWLNSYVQSDGFKQTVLDTAQSSLGSDVQITRLNVSLFSGAQLEGIKVANPKGFDGDLLSADKFILRYRLMPLLKKQLHIEELAIVSPRIVLASDASGKWNYEALTTSGEPAPAPAAATPASETSASASPLDVTLSRMALENGVVEMLDDGKLLIRLQDINMTSSASLAGNRLSGSGTASVAEINAANSLFARNITTPVSIATDEVKLAPLSGQLAQGTVSGSLALILKDAFKYVVDIQLKDGDMPTLLKEAGSPELMTGKLQLNAALEGTGGMETISGKGSADITGGRLAEIPALTLVANLLQIPELNGIAFEECHLEFTMADNVMQTPVIRLKAPKIEITGKGSVQLADYSLNHQMTLAVDKSLLAKLPKEIRSVFKERDDGYLTIDFAVTGPYDAPKTDLTDRLVKGATESLINKGLEKLFK